MLFGLFGKKSKAVAEQPKPVEKYVKGDVPNCQTYWCLKEGDPQHDAVLLLEEIDYFRGDRYGHLLEFRPVGNYGQPAASGRTVSHYQNVIDENWHQVDLQGMMKLDRILDELGANLLYRGEHSSQYHMAVMAMLEQQVLEDPSLADKLWALHDASRKARWEAGIDAKRSYEVSIPEGMPAKVLQGYIVLSPMEVAETTETTLTVKVW